MSDHCEEQEMEAEALVAIFDDCLEIQQNTQPFSWAVTLYPEQHNTEVQNHVGIQLISKIPLEYPEVVPDFEIILLKGLVEEHRQKLLDMAQEEAESNLGLPSIFAVCERLREWLAENNVKGMDDVSMYAQMMRRTKEAEKQTQKAQQEYEAQKQVEGMTEAESEELAVRKRRAEGTPCTAEHFKEWMTRYSHEMRLQAEQEAKRAASEAGGSLAKKKKEKQVDKSGRISGFMHFTDKAGGVVNWEAMELEAENAQRDEDESDDDDDDEEARAVADSDLFDVDDDDLDDLDFDDDDDEDDDEDDDDEPDI